MHVQFISKTTTTYIENCRRSYLYNLGTLLAAACLPAIFTISITKFHLEYPVKKEVKLSCTLNNSQVHIFDYLKEFFSIAFI